MALKVVILILSLNAKNEEEVGEKSTSLSSRMQCQIHPSAWVKLNEHTEERTQTGITAFHLSRKEILA